MPLCVCRRSERSPTDDHDGPYAHGLYGRDDPTTHRDKLPCDGGRVPSRNAIREHQLM